MKLSRQTTWLLSLFLAGALTLALTAGGSSQPAASSSTAADKTTALDSGSFTASVPADYESRDVLEPRIADQWVSAG